jgi:ABC-type antimicrobial peptide transport system permease subunit
MATKSVAVPIAVPLATPERSQWQMAIERFRAHRPAVIGLFVLVMLSLLCAAAPLVSPYDPRPDATARALRAALAHPSIRHR